MLENIRNNLYLNFVKDDRYMWLVDGLKTTLLITVFAVIVGIIIGFLVAIVRSAHDKSGSFKILNAVCRVYLTVIRGTPTMIQLLIMNFVIFGSVSMNKIVVGGLAFGINSALMWRRSFDPASCPSIRDRPRQAGAWALILRRPCA